MSQQGCNINLDKHNKAIKEINVSKQDTRILVEDLSRSCKNPRHETQKKSKRKNVKT